ncbi:MAG TPA: glycosyltransferase family 39 protein [Solirubrobacterales bacterium]|nr:glycosyltransferase family 39 protein [Solirubrobacterales bacterium]
MGGPLRVASPIVAIVALALVVRVLVIAADTGYVPKHDAWDYDNHARSIAAGEGFPPSYTAVDGGPSALRAPGYPYLLAAVYAVSGDRIAVGRLLNAILGALAVGLVYLIAKRIWGRRVGLLAALLTAVFPPLVLLSRDLLSESLFIAVELGAVLCVLEFRRSRALWWAAGAGLLCGLGVLTRNPGPALAVPVLLGVWTVRPRWSWRAAAAPALVLACIVALVLPWTVRNAVEFGRLVPVTTGTGYALAGAYNDLSLHDEDHPGAWRTPAIAPEYQALFGTRGIDEGTIDATLRREATSLAVSHPTYVAEVTGWNLLRLFEVADGAVVGLYGEPVTTRGIGSATPAIERLSIAIAVVLACLGAFAIAASRRAGAGGGKRLPTGPLFLWLTPVLLLLVAAPVNGLPRYRTPADPFILILAAIGILWLYERRPAGRLAAR